MNASVHKIVNKTWFETLYVTTSNFVITVYIILYAVYIARSDFAVVSFCPTLAQRRNVELT